jgi:hypothetical protein
MAVVSEIDEHQGSAQIGVLAGVAVSAFKSCSAAGR